MAIPYQFTKYKDVYTLYNEGGTSFSYTVIKQECTEQINITDGTLGASSSTSITFTTDGEYSIILLSQDGEETLNFSVHYYETLLNSILKNTKKALCGCKCKDCDCEEDYEDCLVPNYQAYLLLNPEYSSTIDIIFPYFICRFVDNTTCHSTKELIYGKSDCKSLTQDLIALNYLGLYLYELNNAEDDEERTYIKSKFNSIEILKCINRLGINTQEVSALLS